MNLATVGVPVSSFVLLAAEGVPASFPVPADVMQGGALLTLSWCVYWVLTKTIPSYQKSMNEQSEAHMRDSKEQREGFLAAIKDMEERRTMDSP